MSFFDLFSDEKSVDNNSTEISFCEHVLSVVSTDCGSCKAYYHSLNPKLTECGTGSNGIMLLLPPVSKNEDLYGQVAYGGAFDWLRSQLAEVGIDFDECIVVNSTGCRAFRKDTQTYNQIEMCRVRLDGIIKKYNPKLIISFGSTNLRATVKPYWSRNLGDIEKWHGFCIPSHRWNAYVVNTIAPDEIVFNEYYYKNQRWKDAKTFPEKVSAIKSSGFYKIYTRTMRDDIARAYKKAFNNPIQEDPAKMFPVRAIYGQEIITYLNYVINKVRNNEYECIAADLETSGLKPFNKEHFIYSIGLMIDTVTGAVAFKLEEEHLPLLRELASLNPRIAGANWKFDRLWFKVKTGMEFDNLYHDVIVAAHLNDNRDGITSLKFNTFVNFGITYEEKAHAYLIGTGNNGLNNVDKAPLEDLLYYNALDVLYTFLLVDIQRQEWQEKNTVNGEFAWKLYHKGSIALSELEYNGITMDLKRAEESRAYCQAKLDEVEKKYKADPIWLEWLGLYGSHASIISDTQIIEIFIKRKGYFPKGISRKAKPKADYEWLTKMLDKCPFLAYVLEVRKWEKILNTYLKSFFTETNDDGKLRCFYSNTKSSSFRMSSDSPNLTNQASRDAEQVSLLKTCFVVDKPDPKTGEEFYLISTDFSQLENFVNASIANDEYFLSTLNGGADMHKDNALFLCFSDPEEYEILKKYDEDNHTKYAKSLRNGGKTGSFSTLYGANATTIGTSLWKAMQENDIHVAPDVLAMDRVMERLDAKNLYRDYVRKQDKDASDTLTEDEFYLECYIKHAQEFFDDFWYVRMKAMGEWRDSTFDFFCRNGYVDYPTGLRAGGLFSRNTILNAPGQGSGACITLWCLCRINYLLRKRGMQSSLRLQIHDDIVGMVPRSEVNEYIKVVKQVMEDETQKVFPWLKTKLQIDPEISATTWADKTSFDKFCEENNMTFE